MTRYVAFTSSDYGYTRMTIVNSAHIDLEQVSDDKVCWVAVQVYFNYGFNYFRM